jgi:hypothetical protein
MRTAERWEWHLHGLYFAISVIYLRIILRVLVIIPAHPDNEWNPQTPRKNGSLHAKD